MVEPPKKPALDENGLPVEGWEIEYEQLGEDFRSLNNVGWQASIAVIVGDALILSPAITSPALWITESLLFVASLLTLFMSWYIAKSNVRGKVIASRLRDYGKAKGFERFAIERSTFLTFPVGMLVAGLMVVVGFGLGLIGFLLFIGLRFPL